MSTKKRDFVLICLFVCLSVDSCNSVDFRFEGFALVELGLLHDDGLLLLLRRHHHEHLLQQLGRVVCSLLVRIPTWNVSFKRSENKREKIQVSYYDHALQLGDGYCYCYQQIYVLRYDYLLKKLRVLLFFG